MKLYGRNTSINVQKAAWVMGEAELNWEWVDKEGGVGTIDSPQYRKINPAAKIPTLDDNGLLVRQSNTIVRYVARKYAPQLIPRDDPAWVEAERWMEWQNSDNRVPLTKVFWTLIRTPENKRDTEELSLFIKVLNDDFIILDEYLGSRKYIAGEEFSIGDIPPGAAAYRYLSLPIERPVLTNLQNWYQKLVERPKFKEMVMIPLA